MIRTKTRFVAITLLIVTIIGILSPSYAYSGDEHYKDLEQVLFGKDGFASRADNAEEYWKDIKYASYLTIDQFGDDGEDQYNALKRRGVAGLPDSFSEIQYSKSLSGDTTITGTNHRKYTHNGWDRPYGSVKEKKFWEKRKTILLSTLNSIFRFNTSARSLTNNKKCQSLAGIIYDVHILGDIIQKTSKEQQPTFLVDIAGRNDGYDMITKMKEYAEILFEDQKKSYTYNHFLFRLEVIERRAKRYGESGSGIRTSEDFHEYEKCAEKLLALLKRDIPKMLAKEEFFTNVFGDG